MHGGRGSPRLPTRSVPSGTVAGMGAEAGETEQNRNFRFLKPEPPGKTGTFGFQNRNLRVLGQNRFNFGGPKTKIFAQLEIWPK